MKKSIILILVLFLIVLSNYCVFAEDSFDVSLQASRTLINDGNHYFEKADILEQDQDFYIFFSVNNPLDIYSYQFTLNFDKTLFELVKDDGTGTLVPMNDNEAPVNSKDLFPELVQAGLYKDDVINKVTTLQDGRTGEIKYLASLSGEATKFPERSVIDGKPKPDTESPYRLASMHFRVKKGVSDGSAFFTLDTDNIRGGVTLKKINRVEVSYSATVSKEISIHNNYNLLYPPSAKYEYTNNNWSLTLSKVPYNISDPTIDIYYNTAPDGTFEPYTGPIPLDANTIVYAYTQRMRTDSITGESKPDKSALITFSIPTVVANPPPGRYGEDLGGYGEAPGGIILFSIAEGYDVYYNIDGTDEYKKFNLATPIKFETGKTELIINAKLGIGGVLIDSTQKLFTYVIRPETPVPTPEGGSYTGSVSVQFLEADQKTKGCLIYYTLDGSIPTTLSKLYDAPINITSTSTLKAIAVKNDRQSSTREATYTIIPPGGGGGGGGGGSTTVYKYITIEKILSELKYKVIDGKAVYEIPKIEGELSGDYIITTDATQAEIEIKFTLQHIIDGAKGLKKLIINTKTDSFILPFYNIDYPLAVEASKGIKPIDVPVTLTYSRKDGESSLIDNANLTKDSIFYSYKLTSFIDKVAFPMKYLVGYAQYIMPMTEVPSGKTPLGVAMNGNIIQTPMYLDKTTAGKESVVLRTLSDHPVCIVYGDKRTYTDIVGNWSQKSIERLSTMRIVNGRPEGFTPDTNITRAELSAMISRAMGAVMKDTVATAFSDLDKTHWSYYEANNAQKWNLIHGYPDFTFKPEQSVTRLETIQMIANALSYTNRDALVNTTEAGKYLLGITDAEEIESWAVPSVVMALKYGIIRGYEDGTLRPNSPITRAETVTLIGRLLENFKLIN